ncbi:MAG TPA: TspO/MBR family protein [Pyrinomonadaceae bacterium]|jgi:tryptophan-rich sensory protein|nr:TspO/MBR family protein [Pyrinomonadaceae bacterium]
MNTSTYLPHGAAQWIGLACAVAVCFAAAGIGSLYTTPAIPVWYASLQKPAWNPPNWLFGPVWTLLYLSMAVAVWLVWRERGFASGAGGGLPLALFAVQLILNALWSIIFFGWKRPGLALVEIFFLWAAIFATMLSFWRVSQIAAWLMWPYLMWVTFAGFLNLAIWKLNR